MKLLQKSGSVSVVIFRCNCLFDNVLGQFVVVGEASIFRHAHEVRIRCCCPCFRFWLEISVVSWPCGRIYRLRLASDRVSHNNHAVSIQLCSWRRVLAIFIADFLHNIDLVALAHTSSSDQFATSVWALLRTVDLVFFSDTIANCIYILAIWADCLDFSLAVEHGVDVRCVVLWLVALLAEARSKTSDVGPVESIAPASRGTSFRISGWSTFLAS